MTDSYGVLAELVTAVSSDEDLYVCPASTEAIIKTINVSDDSSGGYTIKLSIYRASGATTTVFLPTTTLPTGGHGEGTMAVTLRAGDKIISRASGAVSILVFGLERGV